MLTLENKVNSFLSMSTCLRLHPIQGNMKISKQSCFLHSTICSILDTCMAKWKHSLLSHWPHRPLFVEYTVTTWQRKAQWRTGRKLLYVPVAEQQINFYLSDIAVVCIMWVAKAFYHTWVVACDVAFCIPVVHSLCTEECGNIARIQAQKCSLFALSILYLTDCD